MKKIIFSIVALLVLSGCSISALPKTEDISEVYKKDFSALVTAEYGEETAKMEIEKKGMSISFLLREPEELSGMSISLFDEHAEVMYEGMIQNIEKDNLPDYAPFLILKELFEELSEPDEFFLSTADGELIAQGD
ncbi:MAG: membrane lipoprotein lipid attachment site-containing protein, partial [Oscillospiraceae bacterium]|nr:membrane lipoprotein lipid attachment site-containing protein [Oscillospiraceae bacterium]